MLYATVFGGKQRKWAWRLWRNKRDAIKDAKVNDGEVWSHTDVPEVSAWDWPTFRISATRIYPVGE